MYCPKCGKEIKNQEQAFCMHCGEKLDITENCNINNNNDNELHKTINTSSNNQSIAIIIAALVIASAIIIGIFATNIIKMFVSEKPEPVSTTTPIETTVQPKEPPAQKPNNSNEYTENGVRYKRVQLPSNVINKDSIVCQTDYIPYTARYALYKLYWIQKQTPSKRIDLYENQFGMEPDIEWLLPFMHEKTTYELAPNYCLKKNEYMLDKVNCTSNSVKISSLPQKNAPYFKDKDSKGVYYKDYNIPKVWDSYSKQNIDSIIDKQYEKEIKEIQDDCSKKIY